jgi:hypothetical protein
MTLDVWRSRPATGVIGTSGTATDVLNGLKGSTVVFAREYSKAISDPETIERCSQEIEGYLQTLQVLDVMTPAEVEKLINQLQGLRDTLA